MLETSYYTRGTTQITACAVPSRSDKRYPLTRADGRTYWDWVQFSGSEVMGLRRFAAGLHQPPALWELRCLTVFVKAFVLLPTVYHSKVEKSNIFLLQKFGKNPVEQRIYL